MCDPLGASQVLPYLFGLARLGHRITLVSFEKPERGEAERAAVRHACEAAGLDWHPLTYHKQPPVLSTMYDVNVMSRFAARLHRRKRFDLVHCRSYLPALVGAKLKRRTGVPFIFDMRGFWADERREGGSWTTTNPLYRAVYSFFKKREREFWDQAAEIVSLTCEARDEITYKDPSAAPVEVIPCCVDFDLFEPADANRRKAAREMLGIAPSDRALAYIGSLGGNYMLGEMLDFYRAYRQRFGPAKFLFVTHAPEALIRSAARERALPDAEIIVRGASRDEVPRLIAAADEGIAFKQPSYSAKACSPTKLGEMLAVELPVITNSGVGDVDHIIADAGAGVIVRGFDAAAYEQALDELENLSPDLERWRSMARKWFDLETGIGRYDAIYRSIVTKSEARPHAA
jgi:glycosyltransferase involved in cell wall biosynthesis